MRDRFNNRLQKGLALVLLLAALALAFELITHSEFYAELERLNMDNHRH